MRQSEEEEGLRGRPGPTPGPADHGVRGRSGRHGRRWALWAGIAIAVAILSVTAAALAGIWSPSALSAPSRHGGPRGVVNRSTNNSTFPTPIRHVIVIPFENAVASTVLKNGPFFRYLAEQYTYADHYYAICHPSAPNYLALTSGKDWQCGSDGYKVYQSANLGSLLAAANLTWGAFMDSMPAPCATTDSYPYAVKHNPFVYYGNIVGNKSLCDAHVLPLSAWNATVASGTLPNFSFITPNLLNDGHDTSVSYADSWLRGFLGPDLNASWMNNTVIFVTYDEGYLPGGAPDNSGFNGTAGGHVYLSAISPWVRTNGSYPLDASHYNLLSTIEWLLGLPSTGHNDSAAFPAMKGLFDFQLPLSVAPNASPRIGAAPLNISFNATVGNSVGPYAYNWSFGDGNTSNLASPTHTYNRSGLYNVSVTVKDTMNQSGTSFFEVIVTNTTSSVQVDLAANRTHLAAPGNITITANVTGGTPPYQVRWFYNDGSPSANGSSQEHLFDTPGNFTVTVAAIDAHGAIGGGMLRVQVVEPLTVALSLSSTALTVGQTVRATAQATGGEAAGQAYLWTLNGTATGTNSSMFNYTPKGGGNFTVGVTVKDVFNDTASATGQFNVTGTAGGGGGGHNHNNTTSPAPTFPWVTALVVVGVVVLVLAALIAAVVYRRRARPPPRGPPVPGAPVDRTSAPPGGTSPPSAPPPSSP